VTAVPVVVLDDEHKSNSLPASELSRNSGGNMNSSSSNTRPTPWCGLRKPAATSNSSSNTQQHQLLPTVQQQQQAAAATATALKSATATRTLGAPLPWPAPREMVSTLAKNRTQIQANAGKLIFPSSGGASSVFFFFPPRSLFYFRADRKGNF